MEMNLEHYMARIPEDIIDAMTRMGTFPTRSAAGFNESHAVAYQALEWSGNMNKDSKRPSIDVKEGDIARMSPFLSRTRAEYAFKGEREVEVIRWSGVRKTYRVMVNSTWWDRDQLMIKGVDYNE
jgi:hypothetical protein